MLVHITIRERKLQAGAITSGEIGEKYGALHSSQPKSEGVADPFGQQLRWLRGVDLNHRPLGYEPNELPDCSTPRMNHNNRG